jgi:hypothetical protein
MRVGDFLGEPHVAIVKALLLQFQPTFLDILPLYIVLLLVFPLVLIGLRRSLLLVMIPSFLLYLAVQVGNLSVPAYPEGHVWFFNPLAWQILFTAGAALGLGCVAIDFSAPSGRALLAVSAVLVAAGAIVKASWTIHGFWDPLPAILLKELWPINKTNLSPIRLVPFFALVAVVAATVAPAANFLRSAAARPLVLCGQNSLEIFCLGILLSALGHFVLSEYGLAIPVQLAVNAIGIATMFLTAGLIEWYKSMGRASSAQAAGGARP